VVVYGSKTWYLTLREVHRLMALESKVLRRIVGPRRNGSDRRVEKAA
jgi:hypothetical protein